jgi:hypothetical protein
MLIHRGIAAIILIFVSILIGHTPASGRTEFEIGSFRAGANVTVSADEIIVEELLAAGANVKAAGEMKSGLKAFGANVIIPGRVKGKLYALYSSGCGSVEKFSDISKRQRSNHFSGRWQWELS